MKKKLLIGIFCGTLIFGSGSGYSMERIIPQEQNKLQDSKMESDEQFVRRINNCIKNKHDPDTVHYRSFYTWFSDYESFSAEDLTRLYKLLDGVSAYTSSYSYNPFSAEDLTRFRKLLADNRSPILREKCYALLDVFRKQSEYLFSVNINIQQYVRYGYNAISDIMPLTNKQLHELKIRITNNKEYVETHFSHINKLFYPPQIFHYLINDLKYENTLITEEKEQIQRELELTKNQYNNLVEEQKINMIIVNEKLREANNKSSEYEQTISKLTNELQDNTIMIEELNKQVEELNKQVEELNKQIEQQKNSNSNGYSKNNNNVILSYYSTFNK